MRHMPFAITALAPSALAASFAPPPSGCEDELEQAVSAAMSAASVIPFNRPDIDSMLARPTSSSPRNSRDVNETPRTMRRAVLAAALVGVGAFPQMRIMPPLGGSK